MFRTSLCVVFSAVLLACLPPICNAVDGTAQMTGGNFSGGTCMFNNYTLPPGIYGSTMSGSDWSAGAMCGACLYIQGERGTIVTMVRAPLHWYCPVGNRAGVLTSRRSSTNAPPAQKAESTSFKTPFPRSETQQTALLRFNGTWCHAVSAVPSYSETRPDRRNTGIMGPPYPLSPFCLSCLHPCPTNTLIRAGSKCKS